MSAAAPLFLRTFVIGIAVAAPVGAMGVLCIQRTLERGWRAGMATGLGIATADALYAGVAAFGVSSIAASLVSWQTPLRIIGGLALIALGIKAMRTAPACSSESAAGPAAPSRATTYLGAIGLTLTNPMTIMAFGAVFASAGLVAQPGLDTALVATLGVGAGSLAWWTALASSVWLARRQAGERLLSGLNRVSGLVIAGFGLVALASVVLG